MPLKVHPSDNQRCHWKVHPSDNQRCYWKYTLQLIKDATGKYTLQITKDATERYILELHPSDWAENATHFNQIRTKKQNVFYSNSSHGLHTGSSFPFSKKELVIYKWLLCSQQIDVSYVLLLRGQEIKRHPAQQLCSCISSKAHMTRNPDKNGLLYNHTGWLGVKYQLTYSYPSLVNSKCSSRIFARIG